MTDGRDALDWLGLGGAGALPGTRPGRAAAPEVEALAAALVCLAPPAEPPTGLLAAIEAEIDAPAAAHSVLRADEGVWRPLLDKVWRKDLSPKGAAPSIYLLRCEPGAVLPPHDHDRDEHVFVVLEGDFVVDDVIVRAGDYQFAAADSDHAEHRSPEGCLVLVCA
jgi:anti-sigma factor ChrR (cupin superfamily)